MERSRTELLRDAGVNLADFHDEGVVFAITEANAKYRSPAVYNDLLTITTELTEITSYRLTFQSKIFNEAGTLCCKGSVKMVAVATDTMSMVKIPDAAMESITQSFQRNNS